MIFFSNYCISSSSLSLLNFVINANDGLKRHYPFTTERIERERNKEMERERGGGGGEKEPDKDK